MLSYFTLVVALVCGAIAQISDISTTTVSSSDSSSLLTDSSSSLTATTTSTALGSTLAATGSAQITITGWLGVPTGIVGSIVEANPCETTVVLTCTDATYCLMHKDIPVSIRGCFRALLIIN